MARWTLGGKRKVAGEEKGCGERGGEDGDEFGDGAEYMGEAKARADGVETLGDGIKICRWSGGRRWLDECSHSPKQLNE
jgi:hypothetical protein